MATENPRLETAIFDANADLFYILNDGITAEWKATLDYVKTLIYDVITQDIRSNYQTLRSVSIPSLQITNPSIVKKQAHKQLLII